MKKNLLTILIVVFLIAIGLYGYFYAQNQRSTMEYNEVLEAELAEYQRLQDIADAIDTSELAEDEYLMILSNTDNPETKVITSRDVMTATGEPIKSSRLQPGKILYYDSYSPNKKFVLLYAGAGGCTEYYVFDAVTERTYTAGCHPGRVEWLEDGRLSISALDQDTIGGDPTDFKYYEWVSANANEPWDVEYVGELQ